MLSKGTILITGLNGYLAGRAAEAALIAGYDVRGTVRKLSSGVKVQEALSELGYRDRVEVVQVPDITVPGAFDSSVAGATAILHIASPMAEIWTADPAEVVWMSREGVQGLLESAVKAGPQLLSVVLMSSTAAMFGTPAEPKVYAEKDWNTTALGEIERLGRDAGPLNTYQGSKTAAEQQFWKFRTERKPAFGMTAIQATYFIGPPVVPWESREQIAYSIGSIWKVVAGEDIPASLAVYNTTVDVRDVARILVWAALNPKIADGERYLASSADGCGQAVADILSKHMPSLAIKKGNPGQGYKADYTPMEGMISFDSSKIMAATGQDWIPYETSVLDSAKFLQQYLN